MFRMYNLLESPRLLFVPILQAVHLAQQSLDRGVGRHGRIEPQQVERWFHLNGLACFESNVPFAC